MVLIDTFQALSAPIWREILNLLNKTAWTMMPPAPYSAFHLLFTAAGVLMAWFLAQKISRKIQEKDDSRQPAALRRTLFSCGLLLAFMELYKQAFLFFVVNGERYDWWYFPFQLCSVPMYLCLALVRIRSRDFFRVAATFLQDFSLLGGFLALAVPPGLMHPYWTLTLHGFFWHFILIFIGLLCAMTKSADYSLRGYFRSLALFFPCCLIAIFINVAAGPTADADMFYLSPYHASSQPVFHEISMALGIFPGMLLYILAMILGGLLIHTLVSAVVSRLLPAKL